MQRRECVGGVQQISSFMSGRAWREVVQCLSDQFDAHLTPDKIAHKDLFVTEAIRHAVVPSELYPDARVVFKGGTSLAKAHGILNRFSEDIDVNIIPPDGEVFGDNRRKKIRRELRDRLEAGLPLPMQHRRHGSNFTASKIRYLPETV